MSPPDLTTVWLVVIDFCDSFPRSYFALSRLIAENCLVVNVRESFLMFLLSAASAGSRVLLWGGGINAISLIDLNEIDSDLTA